jgi:hypothetical protein
MYLTPLKTAVVEALRDTFNGSYPNSDFQNINISVEYPVLKSQYPNLWVTYEDTAELSIASIGHLEVSFNTQTRTYTQVNRWRFQGSITITIAALSSLERDRLYDEVVRTFAFGGQNDSLNVFRQKIEQNDFVGMNFNFDDLQPTGDTAAMGTPWQTDEMIYEKSLTIDLIGEFVGDPRTQQLVALSKFDIIGTPEAPDGMQLAG